MAPSKVSLLVVSLALVLAACPYETSAGKFVVSVSKYLGKGSTPATVHCYSLPFADKPTTVIQWGQEYIFDFKTALGLQPKFTCDISSGDKKGTILIFDLKRDKPRCRADGVCVWRIYPDGLYLLIAPTNSVEKQFNW